MKKILILTTHYALNPNHSWLVDILAEELAKNSIVKVIFMDWKGEVERQIYKKNGVEVYAHNLQPLQNGGTIKKAFKWLFAGDISYYFYKNEVFQESYDCVIAFAPVLVYGSILKKLSKNRSSKFYLILWDFFPDYHSQLGLINKKLNFIFNYIENKTYSLFDVIGLMSPENVKYFKKNKKESVNQKIEIFPLWGPEVKFSSSHRKNIKSASDKKIFVFGGQLIKGRGLDILLEVAEYAKLSNKNAIFYVFGDGPEKRNFEEKIIELNLENVIFKGLVPREEYFDFLLNSDVGLVFNSGNVTVPTYPSKAIDFYRAGLPILAYVEPSTDFGDILEKEIGAGLYSTPNNKDDIFKKFDQLMKLNDEELFEMGLKGREYFDANLRVDRAAMRLCGSVWG